jgi:hypothetical protein
MLDRITKDELLQSSPDFANAMLAAGLLSTDELFKKFEQLDYKAFGFAAVQLWKFTHDDYWQAGLRNDVNWKEPKLDCIGKTAKEALSLLYGWCVHKGYLKIEKQESKNEIAELLKAFLSANPNDGTWNYQACMSKARQILNEMGDVI